ncbi:response regulator [Pseudoalteromonas tunicata]|jgi:DNA-binding response OmpR family regulator|uniref:Response regulator n=1 Tax=Pseudoalteromonas tunicata D2 TaxID=87626 RepID=A4C4K7_9GAMM|nr:response regulator [Pseudoalteromonas tunicata]ATC97030.1 two-component system, OmpR family, response regulator [Pseudoalteromonas tunicata]AXT33149.1 DNA-binding response regulator [Pseudoalteromonas tunicata]EAR30489.1 response regulator [Pseudoalteromonas tunicata D2]MDP4984865.1 response regulator [Pseudoalteromonas tunicata]MDP5213848.1 response regulator [Pseudoalteromonas tunicata]
MRVLIVEDDQLLAQGLLHTLRHEGYSADHCATAKSALFAIDMAEADLIILDLGLPDMDGLALLKQVRKKYATLPVLVLTARDGTDDKIKGLDLGADDYLAKPFEVTELLARLRVMTRRIGKFASSTLEVGDVALNLAANTVVSAGTGLELPRKEYMVLKALMEHPGRIQSREQLETKLYQWGEEVSSNAVEVHIHHLRKKLPEGFIKTVRGIGYIVGKA